MESKEYLDILYEKLNEISPISQEVWEDAKGYFKLKSLKKSQNLFNIGDKVEKFYFLVEGLARYYYISDNGKEFNKSFAEKPGHLISSISSVSMDNEVAPFCVETLSDFRALYIKYCDFIYLGEKYPQWNSLILKIYEKLIFKKERREADFLLLDAQGRYLKFLDEYSMIANTIQNYHIASYLGITEVALSRIRKELGLT